MTDGTADQNDVKLADHLESMSEGLAMLTPVGPIQLGIKRSAQIIAALRASADFTALRAKNEATLAALAAAESDLRMYIDGLKPGDELRGVLELTADGISRALNATPGSTALGWRPIETAPKDGTFIDLWFPHNGDSAVSQRLMCRWRNDAWFTQCGGRSFRMDNPTHWMLLPNPPAALTSCTPATTRAPSPLAALKRMVDAFRPFTMKPMGGPGSAVRMEQEEQKAAHTDAIRAIAAAEGR